MGYDSYRHTFVYGHRYYELTAYSFAHEHELPVAIQMAEARRHDAVLSLMTMHEAKDALHLPIQVGGFDTASDNLPFYQILIEDWGVIPVIPFNPRNTQAPRLVFDEHGRPLCDAGFPLYYWGRCPDRNRLKWRCPLKATQKDAQRLQQKLDGKGSDADTDGDGDKFPYPCLCSNSSYGRVIYTYPQDNYRHHPPLPRHTREWKRHRKKRTAVERSHASNKEGFGLRRIRTAGRERWFFWIMMAAMLQHVRAWAKEAGVWRDQAGANQARNQARPRAPN